MDSNILGTQKPGWKSPAEFYLLERVKLLASQKGCSSSKSRSVRIIARMVHCHLSLTSAGILHALWQFPKNYKDNGSVQVLILVWNFLRNSKQYTLKKNERGCGDEGWVWVIWPRIRCPPNGRIGAVVFRPSSSSSRRKASRSQESIVWQGLHNTAEHSMGRRPAGVWPGLQSLLSCLLPILLIVPSICDQPTTASFLTVGNKCFASLFFPCFFLHVFVFACFSHFPFPPAHFSQLVQLKHSSNLSRQPLSYIRLTISCSMLISFF